jgi:cellulose synthase/poly-beta-1,6-N-acetylglucosamine synthase-like glycosyltransferase
LLTVFIPSYNHSDFVLETIREALNIPVKDKILYIIDDGSTDDSVDKIETYISELDNKKEITFIVKDKNSGVVDSLNKFLDFCDTEFIYLMASDDIVIGKQLAKVVDIMSDNPGLQFVISGGTNLFFDGTETHIYGKTHKRFFNLPAKIRTQELYLNCPSPILSQSSVIRTSALKAIGGWDKSLIADDYAMFIKLLSRFPVKDRDFMYLPENLCVKYRHHDGNSYKKLLRQYNVAFQTLDKLTPVHLKQKALANKLGFYIAICVKRGDFSTLCKLMESSPKTHWFCGYFMMIKYFFVGLRNKCNL